MNALSILRRRVPAVLVSVGLGIFVGDAIATAPAYEPIDFRPPAFMVKAIQQAKAFFTPAPPSAVPLPTQGTKSVPFQSPWMREKEFGNSEPVSKSAALGNSAIQDESATPSESAPRPR